MQKIATQVLAGLITLGIAANVAAWASFGSRLSRIEAKLENLDLRRVAANKP